MSHHTKLTLSDDAWTLLQRVPEGRRSEVVSRAVITNLTLHQRREAAERMDARRKHKAKQPGTAEQWIREDRDSH